MYPVTKRSQVMEIVQTLSDEQISYIFNIIQSLPTSDSPHKKCTLRGRFASYANPELRQKRKKSGQWLRRKSMVYADANIIVRYI